ncbi:MAG TPA: hypothetical protein VFK79_08575 [Xanthobacteraceae bacterium]|nr:hypothetical protein [Xanthobacteraceae bacterium]
MTKMRTLSGLITATLLATAAVAFNATPSKAADVRLECDVEGPHETRLHARYEERVRPTITRKKFDAQFEALAGGTFSAGQRITFTVDSVVVGSAPLKVIVGRELAAELDLDSPQDGGKPWPANFPRVRAGSVVKAKLGTSVLLGCAVQ